MCVVLLGRVEMMVLVGLVCGLGGPGRGRYC